MLPVYALKVVKAEKSPPEQLQDSVMRALRKFDLSSVHGRARPGGLARRDALTTPTCARSRRRSSASSRRPPKDVGVPLPDRRQGRRQGGRHHPQRGTGLAPGNHRPRQHRPGRPRLHRHRPPLGRDRSAAGHGEVVDLPKPGRGVEPAGQPRLDVLSLHYGGCKEDLLVPSPSCERVRVRAPTSRRMTHSLTGRVTLCG